MNTVTKMKLNGYTVHIVGDKTSWRAKLPGDYTDITARLTDKQRQAVQRKLS